MVILIWLSYSHQKLDIRLPSINNVNTSTHTAVVLHSVRSEERPPSKATPWSLMLLWIQVSVKMWAQLKFLILHCLASLSPVSLSSNNSKISAWQFEWKVESTSYVHMYTLCTLKVSQELLKDQRRPRSPDCHGFSTTVTGTWTLLNIYQGTCILEYPKKLFGSLSNHTGLTWVI